MKAQALKHWFSSGSAYATGSELSGRKFWHRFRRWVDYAVTVPLVLVALGLSFLLAPLVTGAPLFTVFVVVALMAAWYGGPGPGIVCLLTGLLVADFFFIEPVHKFGPDTPEALAVMLINICAGCIGLAAIVNLHRARSRERQVRDLAAQLANEVEQHRKALEELNFAKSQLDDHARYLEERVANRTAELAETVRSLEGVLYHVAHDLRSPLRSLSGFTVLLMDSISSRLNSEEKGSMNRIVTSAERMDRLILDLLAYGRLAHVTPVLRETNLDELVHNVINNMDKEVKASHAVVEVSPPLLPVQTDRDLIICAIEELLFNSLEFTAPGVQPHVHIWTELRENRVRFFIQDNGIGIAPSYQKRIFQVFERLHPRADDSSTGIGLAMVAKTMERLGGKAGVESEPGKGSRFWFELPQA